MTIKEIRERIEAMKDMDNELAHGEEDALREDVLKAIAAGATNAAELAEEALKSSDLDFTRWYA